MIAKLILVIGFSMAVSGGLLPAAHLAPAVPVAPILKPVHDYDPHPQYTYAYDVQDALTGDSKSQHETRNGDVVTGSYSLIEADGTRRIVEYTADPINGFNAVVHREPAVVKAIVPAGPHPVAHTFAPAPVHPGHPIHAGHHFRF